MQRWMTLLVVLLPVLLPAQSRELDSLVKILPSQTGNEKTDVLNRITEIQILDLENFSEAREFNLQAKEEARKAGYLAGMAAAQNNLALIYQLADKDPVRARETLSKAVDLLAKASSENEKLVLANTYRLEARLYHAEYNITKSADFYLRSLTIYEDLYDNMLGALLEHMQKNGSNVTENTLTKQTYVEYTKAHPTDKDVIPMARRLALHTNRMLKTYVILSSFFRETEDWKRALQYSHQARSFAVLLGKTEDLCQALAETGWTYVKLGDDSNAVRSFREEIVQAKTIPATNFLAGAFNDLAAYYKDKGDFDRSMHYYGEALKVSQAEGATAFIKSQIGLLYLSKREYDHAIGYFDQALTFAEKAKAKKFLCASHYNLAMAFDSLRNASKAMEHIRQAHALALTLSDKNVLLDIYHAMSSIYDHQGKISEGYRYFRRYISLRDSLYNQQKANELANLQKRFEVEKKDNEIDLLNNSRALQQAELEKRATQRNFIAAGLGLVLILGLVLLRGYQQKRKAHFEITAQKQIIEEKQKEVLDSIRYARRIQKALMAPENYIHKHLERQRRG